MAVEVWNDAGEPVVGEHGELVCTQPFPSAPVGFWNDPDGARYRAAYFERFEGIWAHGDFAELTKHPEIMKLVEGIVEEKNRHLARYETIKKFVVLPHDLTQAANEITPTMKVRRKIVTAKYEHLLEKLYQ